MIDPLNPDTSTAPAATPAEPLPVVDQEPVAAPPETLPAEPVAASLPLQPPVPEPAPAPVTELPVAEAAPLATADRPPSTDAPAAAEVFGLPLKLVNELLARIGATPLHSLGDLVPVLRILGLALVAGIALKLTSATLGAIDDLPLVGGLLELVGLVSLLNFLARNAFKQQKRAELLARIQKLRTDLLG